MPRPLTKSFVDLLRQLGTAPQTGTRLPLADSLVPTIGVDDRDPPRAHGVLVNANAVAGVQSFVRFIIPDGVVVHRPQVMIANNGNNDIQIQTFQSGFAGFLGTAPVGTTYPCYSIGRDPSVSRVRWQAGTTTFGQWVCPAPAGTADFRILNNATSLAYSFPSIAGPCQWLLAPYNVNVACKAHVWWAEYQSVAST